MEIYDVLLKTPQRENAGSIVPNRYQYQYHWALIKMLELYNSQDDFAMFFEFGDDILILDSSENPTKLDFYQIKTNQQNNVFYWKLADLTNKGSKKKPKTSYLEKLIDNYVRYKYENIKSVRFVSNLPFKFSEKSILAEQECSLAELTNEEFKKIKTQTCNICKKSNCKDDCKNIIYFSCSGISIEHFRETCIGKLNTFLNSKFSNYSISPNVLYDVILKDIEIKSINNKENKTKEDLIRAKCIDKQQLNRQLTEFNQNTILHNKWTEVDGKFSSFFPVSKRKFIKKAFNKFTIDSLNPDNIVLEQIINTVRDLIIKKCNNSDIDNKQLKTLFYEICNETIVTNQIDTNLYDENYILAIILREYCYE